MQRELPEPVEAAAGDVGEVEGRGAGAAHRLRAFDEACEELEVVDFGVVDVVAEAGGEEGPSKLALRRDVDGPTVEGGPAAPGRREELVLHGVVHDADLADPVPLDADRDREVGKAVRVVRRAVERVDDPQEAARPRLPGGLLAYDGIVGARVSDALEDPLLGEPVDLGHEIDLGALRLDRVGLVDPVALELAHLGRDRDRELEDVLQASPPSRRNARRARSAVVEATSSELSPWSSARQATTSRT